MKRIVSVLYNDFAHLDRAFPAADCIIANRSNLPELSSSDIVIFHGGTDLDPSVYGHSNVGSEWPDVYRDVFETQMFDSAVKAGCLILGICRGAQLACAKNGGFLYQHVEGHTGNGHDLLFEDGSVIRSNTCHHQMMGLKGTKHKLIAFTKKARSRVYISDGDAENPDVEPEVVWFPGTRTLAVQGHPEWLDFTDPFVKKVISLLKQYALVTE